MLSGIIDQALSWEELGQCLTQQQPPEEQTFRRALAEGRVHNALASLRLFGDDTEKDVRVKLYRDSAAWCPYCHKVWLLLEEKQVSYRVEKINMRCYGDKPTSYTRKYGQLLPAAEIDGQGITESNDIMQAIEQRFPARPMTPTSNTDAGRRVRPLLRLERDLFGAWLQWLCSPRNARAQFEETMDEVDRELGKGGGPYFLSGVSGAPGDGFGIVDIMFAPFLERIAASIPYFKGLPVRRNPRWPHINAWYDAMDRRPAYAPTKSDFYTHCHDLPPQLGGCHSAADAKRCQAEVDGQDAKGWALPLPDSDAACLEPFALSPNGSDARAARREAAERLVHNHKAIARFAARGAGSPGPKPVSAPLADPTAVPAEAAVPAVDLALRHISHALLEGPKAVTPSAFGAASAPTAASLQYLKDRVGVPRDMSYAAARQLRAHISWFQQHLAHGAAH